MNDSIIVALLACAAFAYIGWMCWLFADSKRVKLFWLCWIGFWFLPIALRVLAVVIFGEV